MSNNYIRTINLCPRTAFPFNIITTANDCTLYMCEKACQEIKCYNLKLILSLYNVPIGSYT